MKRTHDCACSKLNFNPSYPLYASTNDINYLANVNFNLIQLLCDCDYIRPSEAMSPHSSMLSECMCLLGGNMLQTNHLYMLPAT